CFLARCFAWSDVPVSTLFGSGRSDPFHYRLRCDTRIAPPCAGPTKSGISGGGRGLSPMVSLSCWKYSIIHCRPPCITQPYIYEDKMLRGMCLFPRSKWHFQRWNWLMQSRNRECDTGKARCCVGKADAALEVSFPTRQMAFPTLELAHAAQQSGMRRSKSEMLRWKGRCCVGSVISNA